MIAFGPRRLDQIESILNDYFDARELCAKHRDHLRRHVRSLVAFQQRNGTHASETALLSAWLAELAEGRAPATVNGYRQSVLALLRFATPDDEPLPRTDRIRRQREPDQIKPAFTRAEIRQLIHRAKEYRPTIARVYGRGLHGDTVAHTLPDGTPWSLWWEAFIRAAYDSGQYLSDLRRLRWSDLRPDGSATIVRHKTGRFVSFRLRPATLRACRKLGDRELVLPWRWNAEAWFARRFKRYVLWAGVRELTAKSLRRSAITYTYIEQGPEAARMLAGHASFATTARHYIDWSIARRPAVEPPPL